MNVRHILPMAVITILSLYGCGDAPSDDAVNTAEQPLTAAAPDQASIRWFDGSIDEAFAAAKEQRKPVFLYWGEEWCPFCNRLEAKVFTRDEFIALSHEFIALYLGTDTEEKIEYGDRFGIRGFPTVIVFDPDGVPITRIDGGADIEQYARVLETTLGEVRPVGELVHSVQAGEQLTGGEWTVLASYPWRYQADLVLDEDADKHALMKTFAERAPDDMPDIRHQMAMLELSAWLEDDDRDMALAPYYWNYLQAVMANEQRMEESFSDIAFSGGDIINFVLPEEQQAGFRSRILDDIVVALDDPSTIPLERIELLMGWLNVSTATLGEDETLSDAELDWLQAQAEAARQALPADQLQTGIFYLSSIYRQAGLVEQRRNVLKQGIAEAQAPYYFMVSLSRLERSENNPDEALGWCGKAWEASTGPVTRARWGNAYLNCLVELSPDDVATIRDTGLQILAEIADQDNWAENHARNLTRLSTSLLEWSEATESAERLAALDTIRGEMQRYCKSAGTADQQPTSCENFLVAADSA
jgi:thiol-disulfide isomerase/thioredoxin